MTKVIFACDESGAKGYADKGETYPGEVGVFAGFLILDECVGDSLPKFMEIYNRYKPPKGKHHITDLDNHLKESLRQEVYQTIRDFTLPCFWYAIHVEGLHAYHISTAVIVQKANEILQEVNSEKVSHIKCGSPRTNPASMHIELFCGLYGHLIAFLEERERKEVDIEIRIDQIDNPIVEDFEAIAKKLLSQDPVVHKTTGWNTVTETKVDGEIKVELKLPQHMHIETVIRSLSIKPVGEEDGFVLAADVLANSLNHLFKNRQDVDRYSDLNTPEAVATHPLAKYLDTFNDWGVGDIVGDRLYSHPKAPKI